ncbi:MAG: hypothetical protein AAF125_05225 [Chloroflexota bacterium]
MQKTLGKLDPLMDRLLFVRPADMTDRHTRTAENAFSFSLLFSGVRCILQYIVLPFALPLVGVAVDAAVPILMVINTLAVVSVVFSLRRFWRVRYDYRWVYLFVAVVAIGLLMAFLVMDLRALHLM